MNRQLSPTRVTEDMFITTMNLHLQAAIIFAQAAMAGFVDTVGFVALFGVFTAHVTGNFVLLGAQLARPGQGAAIKLLAFPAFIVAVAAATWIVPLVRALRN